jgi:hypothetical protein
MVHGRPKYR